MDSPDPGKFITLYLLKVGQANLIYSLSSPPTWNFKIPAIIFIFQYYHVLLLFVTCRTIFCAAV